MEQPGWKPSPTLQPRLVVSMEKDVTARFACPHSQMAVFASPGRGEVAEAAYQRLEPKREGSG